MIDAGFVEQMARYNAWQNRQLKAIFRDRGEASLKKTGKAHFGSIFATANHLLWADRLWLARLLGTAPPEAGLAESPDFTGTLGDWEIARFRTDARLLSWAEDLKTTDLWGLLTWHSLGDGEEMTRPKAQAVMHLFNHQTHHRGQIHAMLTAANAEAPVSDLSLMPQQGPWL